MPPTQPADNVQSLLVFHDAYLGVIYGLVATNGLGYWLELNAVELWHFPVPPYFLLFVGVFVLGLHFWFVCAGVERCSTAFYGAFVGWKWAKFLLLLDDLVATGFAGIVLAMFANLKDHSGRLLLWFGTAAVASLIYDGYSKILIYAAQNASVPREAPALNDYRTAVNRWFVQDGTFFVGVLLVYFLSTQIGVWHLASQVALLAVSAVILVLDVKFLPAQ